MSLGCYFRAKHMDWDRAPLSAFFRGPLLHSPEGLIVLAGSGASLLFAVLAWLAPGAIFLPEKRVEVAVTLFAIWPICLFTIYVRMCAPEFRPRVFTTLFILASAALPFWLAYRGDAV
jgi:hypothetical protein